MQGPQEIERYRRMTPQEGWKITVELMEMAWSALLLLPPDERERRLDLARRAHDESNDAIAAGLK